MKLFNAFKHNLIKSEIPRQGIIRLSNRYLVSFCSIFTYCENFFCILKHTKILGKRINGKAYITILHLH